MSQLQRVHADSPQALFYHESLAPVVDACARSTTRLDEAFFLLEDMHLQVWGAAALGCCMLLDTVPCGPVASVCLSMRSSSAQL